MEINKVTNEQKKILIGILNNYAVGDRIEYDAIVNTAIWYAFNLEEGDTESFDRLLQSVGFYKSDVSYCYLRRN